MTREEAKRSMFFAQREVFPDSYIYKAYDVAIKALGEPERKTGAWVGINEYLSHLREETGEFYKVSNLYDAIQWCNSCWHSNKQKTNFCPNCGADMRGEQDG